MISLVTAAFLNLFKASYRISGHGLIKKSLVELVLMYQSVTYILNAAGWVGMGGSGDSKTVSTYGCQSRVNM